MPTTPAPLKPPALSLEIRELRKAFGRPAVDGLELLVGQGALSFQIFTGVPASLDGMRAAVAA